MAAMNFFPMSMLLLAILMARAAAQGVEFTRSPAAMSSHQNAAFEFVIRGKNGSSPCISTQCSILCQLDAGPFQDCSSRSISYSGLVDGNHTFVVTVVVNAASSQRFTATHSWIIDTVPPTASVVPRTSFTNGFTVTVDIDFSEPCLEGGNDGFACSDQTSCDLMVRGAGVVLPSTLKVVRPQLVYSLQVSLSNATLKGRVVLAMSRMACTDAAGNKFQRAINSSAIVRFDRSEVFVNLWTPIADSKVIISNQGRTVQATNNPENLKIYLDFTEPVVNTTEELLRSLHSTAGVLSPTRRKSRGNRRFAFVLLRVPSPTVVTVSLDSARVMSRAGSFVQPVSSVSFIFDEARPRTRVSTDIRTRTRGRLVPVLVRFSEPVFQFVSSGVTVAGGRITSFKAISTSTYFAELSVARDGEVSVVVPENTTADVAGNTNFPSNILHFKHYQVPPISVAFYIFTTAGMLLTTLASGALSISAATLAAAGALTSRTVGTIVTDPSRNLLGMTGHLQVFALSGFLILDLPTDYVETVRGLRWIIPHVRVPWESGESSPEKSIVLDSTPSSMTNRTLISRSLLSTDGIQLQRRELGANGSLFGPPLGFSEYQRYFENQTNFGKSLQGIAREQYSGWKDFQMNMFWLAAGAAFVIVLHILVLQVLKWRTGTSMRGALSIPRFELFVLIFALPCVSQASTFIIEGGTTLGIVIGVLLLAVPAGFMLSLFIFLLVGVIFGGVVQYKEIRVANSQISCSELLFSSIVGKRTIAKWVRKEGLSPTFLPRYGLVFEDRKGPPRVVLVEGEDAQKWVESGTNGIGRMKALNSDEENERVPVSGLRNLLGAARVLYILVDIARRIVFGIVFGAAYTLSEHARSQVIILLGLTIFQLSYLILCKPYIRRGVQTVETLSLACETGLFAAAYILLHHPSKENLIGIILIVFLLVSFAAQLINEWYALIGLLLRLSPTDDQSFNVGLKMFGRGLVLLFVPKSRWPRFVTPQQQEPRTGLTHHVVARSPDFQHFPDPQAGSPIATAGTGPSRTFETGSPSSPVPGPAPAAALEEQRGSSRQKQGSWSAWARSWSSSEGKSDPKMTEMKMLRELAKASFSGTQAVSGAGSGGSPDRGKQKAVEEAIQQDPSSENSSNSSSVSLTAGFAPSSSHKLFPEPQEALVLRRATSSGRRTLDDR